MGMRTRGSGSNDPRLRAREERARREAEAAAAAASRPSSSGGSGGSNGGSGGSNVNNSKPQTVTGNVVVDRAYSQLGKPYRYGGSTPRGFDCSGLIWWAYRQHGVTVPRVTTDQARAGKAVKANAMRPGDVLVFKSRSSARGLHTALYAGNGTFVHSPSSGSRVRTDKIANSYWSKRLIRVRRILR